MTESIQVEIIPQLKDNYSYIIYSNVKKLAIVIESVQTDYHDRKNTSDGKKWY